MKKIVLNNTVMGYYLDNDSYIIGAVKTYVYIQNRFFYNQNRINKAITDHGKVPENLFFLIDKKEMYISLLKRIEKVYCLKPF